MTHTPQPRLSVAVIARDAQAALQETMDSVAAWTDQLVVVDAQSSDATSEVARRQGATLVEHCWADDFSAARNAAIEQVRGDWLLWLDAGETLEAETGRRIRRFVQQEAQPDRAYMLLVKVPPAPEQIEGEQVGQVRLVPADPRIHFRGRVGECLEESLHQQDILVQGLPYSIHRGAREHDPAWKRRQAECHIRLAELSIRECGPTARLLNCLAAAHEALGQPESARSYYQQALDASERGSAEMLEAFYGLLTVMERDAQQLPAQVATCVQALDVYPLDMQLLCALGGYLQAQGRLDLATRSYHTAYHYGQVAPTVWHMDQLREVAAACYSLALQLQHRNEEAQQLLEEALAARPHAIRLRRQLLDLHIKQGNREEAWRQFDALPADLPQRDATRRAVEAACLASQRKWQQAVPCLELAYQQGCRDAICLRWLSAALLATGQQEKAKPVLQAWRRLDPASIEARCYLKTLEKAADSPGRSAGFTPS